mmetsp:Transcript_28068/g.68241  ORF Transcript_28068/g.68241 Transcript_28068/m.68241 type:complete len:270 (-) Transcript_28068:31-840(-)
MGPENALRDCSLYDSGPRCHALAVVDWEVLEESRKEPGELPAARTVLGPGSFCEAENGPRAPGGARPLPRVTAMPILFPHHLAYELQDPRARRVIVRARRPQPRDPGLDRARDSILLVRSDGIALPALETQPESHAGIVALSIDGMEARKDRLSGRFGKVALAGARRSRITQVPHIPLERLRELPEVPERDVGLLPEGVPSRAVDVVRREALVVPIEEAVHVQVEGDPHQGHVVGVHDAVGEPVCLPRSDEGGGSADDDFEQRRKCRWR